MPNFRKTMKEVGVYIEESRDVIFIRQPNIPIREGDDLEDDVICIDHEQVELLVSWLRQAADSIKKKNT